ncbi:MAG: PilZ domain-containing protein [Gammaproteobacteria bacterium]|nr:PilZ domain-containing protein [Gammaproteobacteria bacterium]
MNEKRHFQRIEFDSTTHIANDRGSWEAPLVDICLKGMLTAKPADFTGKVGDHFTVEMRLTSSDILISMNARIAHIEENSIGFECENMDIDSVTHLRRLVELNLGDTNLLDRELSELVALGK